MLIILSGINAHLHTHTHTHTHTLSLMYTVLSPQRSARSVHDVATFLSVFIKSTYLQFSSKHVRRCISFFGQFMSAGAFFWCVTVCVCVCVCLSVCPCVCVCVCVCVCGTPPNQFWTTRKNFFLAHQRTDTITHSLPLMSTEVRTPAAYRWTRGQHKILNARLQM